uniref:15-cis-phytoene synthase n=1 Tax=Pseudictyota dubia TaxID=2749911 RepID=A0A7R9YX38_9STRA
MAKFGVTEEQIMSQRLDDNYVALMKYSIDRARMYYDRARRGVPMLAPYSRLPVQASLDCYALILDRIEENGYDNLTKRAYATKWEKLAMIPFSWYRTQDMYKSLPLPWDEPPAEKKSDAAERK